MKDCEGSSFLEWSWGRWRRWQWAPMARSLHVSLCRDACKIWEGDTIRHQTFDCRILTWDRPINSLEFVSNEDIDETFEGTVQIYAEDFVRTSRRWVELRAGDDPLSLRREDVWQERTLTTILRCGEARNRLDIPGQRYNFWNRDVQNLIQIFLWSSNRWRNLRQSLTIKKNQRISHQYADIFHFLVLLNDLSTS